MELPYHLKALPPEALDVLRYFSKISGIAAHADDITAGADLSDRGFGKAIRRLVTKGYLTMGGEQYYRLSDSGRRAVDDLINYDEDPTPYDNEAQDDEPELDPYDALNEYSEIASAAQASPLPKNFLEEVDAPIESFEDLEMGATFDDAPTEPVNAETAVITRQLVTAVPKTFVESQPVRVYVGFDEANEANQRENPIQVILRFNVLEGTPETRVETSLLLSNRSAYQIYEVIPNPVLESRIRVEVLQYDENTQDYHTRGGIYVDVPVNSITEPSPYTAYGTSITFE